jgi:hypothetical protein
VKWLKKVKSTKLLDLGCDPILICFSKIAPRRARIKTNKAPLEVTISVKLKGAELSVLSRDAIVRNYIILHYLHQTGGKWAVFLPALPEVQNVRV